MPYDSEDYATDCSYTATQTDRAKGKDGDKVRIVLE